MTSPEGIQGFRIAINTNTLMLPQHYGNDYLGQEAFLCFHSLKQ